MRALLAAMVVLTSAPAFAAEPIPMPRPERAEANASTAPIVVAEIPVPRPAPSDRPSGSAATVADPYGGSEAPAQKVSLNRNIAAKKLFGAVRKPAPLKARSIGSYARGCLAGAVPLAVDGPTWQVMRLSRNRNWGHPTLVAFLEKLAKKAPSLGWSGLMVGDLAQPRGGPMLTGHASHQIGLDADIWLTPMPNRVLSREERESISAKSVLGGRYANAEIPEGGAVDRNVWTDAHAKLIREAARDKRVARIFVHPAIKKKLCDWESGDKSWLRRVRPWYGHHYHFHVRLACPADSAGCKDQSPPPAGDGCDKSLDWWLSDAPYEKRRKRKAAAAKNTNWKPMTITALPDYCETVLVAQ
ncbi:MAG: penicillin-insensitive murein endopeptidase [Hyphomicrobiales bacterium]|nr:MAG: penicillin-insensitive murein endopeptidase [Hyphomicrobiales bacterium]